MLLDCSFQAVEKSIWSGRSHFGEPHGADAVYRSASSFNPDEVVPQVVELLLDPGLSGVADGHNTDDSGNPNGDAQDRQDASHLVPEEGHHRRSKQGPVVHNSSSPDFGRIFEPSALQLPFLPASVSFNLRVRKPESPLPDPHSLVQQRSSD
jgi:hypothetical protein